MLKSLLSRFANDLKVMVDETFGKPVADALNNDIASIKAKTTFECGFRQGAKDSELIRETRQSKRVLLTFDRNTINETRYPPCSHGGIIIVKDPHWTATTIVQEMKALTRSGRRKLARHGVTHLYRDRAVIYQHEGLTEVVHF
ncbi:MAG: DUF5615 family PIN-like protein [Acidobacteriota bacterium]